MTQTISSRILKTAPIKWRELVFLQDDNFKEWISDGDVKLHESLKKYQFIDPFKVWENNGQLYCLDGKHRYMDLVSLIEKGVEIPEELPATFINCQNETEAAEMVLVYSSAYARVTQFGFATFIEKFNLEFPSLNHSISLPEFDMVAFERMNVHTPLDAFVREEKGKPAVMRITFSCPEQLEAAKIEIEELLKRYLGSFFSVSAGEI